MAREKECLKSAGEDEGIEPGAHVRKLTLAKRRATSSSEFEEEEKMRDFKDF